jgi:hypothetical protein
MNLTALSNQLQTLVDHFASEQFMYDVLLAYEQSKAAITRLKKGSLNLARNPNNPHDIIWKKKLYFKPVHLNTDGLSNSTAQDLHQLISDLNADPATHVHQPRFIIVMNAAHLLAVDTKTHDTLDIALTELPRHYDFFLPWAGMEKAVLATENIADVKAASNMAKLYDLIRIDNPTPEQTHSLNVFLSRLLFCFFAEDTDIFQPSQFTHAIHNHTAADGSNVHTYLDTLFEVMNTPKKQRPASLPQHLAEFEYVNGGLFRDPHPSPVFDRKSRDLLLTLGSLDWAEINPDIFGSMIQAVVMPDQRGSLGMHYTSVPNIMKVIEPLFLDELNAALDEAQFEPRKLNALLERISRIKLFDPACGSGNFLIIAYKELCAFEIRVLQRLQTVQEIATGFELPQRELIPKAQLGLASSYQMSLFSRIELSQFYGIEIDDFAHEIAILSLWLAQHQMNVTFKKLFGAANPTLPLAPSGNIVHGNACREDWEDICPKSAEDEVYVLGNPPYLGSAMQSAAQKAYAAQVFADNVRGYKNLDFIACWFYKGAQFIRNSRAQFAFVTTNSICQGEQVALLWPHIFKHGLEIGFAYTSFKWINNAKHNAGVTVAVIGVRKADAKKPQYLFTNGAKIQANNINAYLAQGAGVIVEKCKASISNLPPMTRGEEVITGDPLILNRHEKDSLLAAVPTAEKYLKRIIGAKELIDSTFRYVIYPSIEQVDEASSIPELNALLTKALKIRREKRKLAEYSNLQSMFTGRILPTGFALAAPRVSSERREYIPLTFIEGDTFVSDAAQIIYNAEPWLFAALTSKIHMTWVKAVCGRLKTDYRYSSSLCYNTFPFPSISATQKAALEKTAYGILDAREAHSELTLAQMYDPDKMPADLRAAHHANDLAVERCYRSRLFESDDERLAYLFKEYERMIKEAQTQT